MAYTPGLKIKELVIIRKTRRLPIKGEVLVNVEDRVTPNTIVARTNLPGDAHIVSVANELGLDDPGLDPIEKYMLRKVGSRVEKGEVIAKLVMFFGLVKKVCTSPVKGSIELISNISGQVVVRGSSFPVEVDAYVPGVISEVMPSEGVVVETLGAFIQGIFGIGGETQGELKVVSSGIKPLDEEAIGSDCSGKILIARTRPTLNALKKAIQVGAKGLVSGCIDEKELNTFMGYELGVAITGEEDCGITLVITEGFGDGMKMSDRTFNLLGRFDGKLASINGATQIRAGVMRPEIIIPQLSVDPSVLKMVDREDTEVSSEGLKPGVPIRIIREPHFGALAKVLSLPHELKVVDTESEVRVLEAELEDGRRVMVPRANVEIISE